MKRKGSLSNTNPTAAKRLELERSLLDTSPPLENDFSDLIDAVHHDVPASMPIADPEIYKALKNPKACMEALPEELLSNIAGQFEKMKTLAALGATSKQFQRIAKAILYEQVSSQEYIKRIMIGNNPDLAKNVRDIELEWDTRKFGPCDQDFINGLDEQMGKTSSILFWNLQTLTVMAHHTCISDLRSCFLIPSLKRLELWFVQEDNEGVDLRPTMPEARCNNIKQLESIQCDLHSFTIAQFIRCNKALERFEYAPPHGIDAVTEPRTQVAWRTIGDALRSYKQNLRTFRLLNAPFRDGKDALGDFRDFSDLKLDFAQFDVIINLRHDNAHLSKILPPGLKTLLIWPDFDVSPPE